MDLNEYQKRALETVFYPKEYKIICPSLGLAGESGEVCEKVKKVIRDKTQKFDTDKCREIARELGDVLWYTAVMASDLGYTLDEIAQINQEKLKSRQQRNKLQGEGDNR